MSTKNTKRKKESIFNSKNLIVFGISAAVVILFSLISTLVFLPDEDEITTTVSSARIQESGLNPVYTEEAVPVTGEVSTDTTAEEQTENLPEASPPPQTGYAPPVTGAVINDYSGDELVYSKTLNDWRTHNGIDFFAEEGTDVLSASDGTVEAVTENGMYGKTVIILHNEGVRTIYSNLGEGIPVKEGDLVTQGMPIGKVGASASAEAMEESHLHFEMSLNEEPVNPHDYLPDTSSSEE